MPHSQYIPANEPPSRGDRFLARPFMIALSWASLAVGVRILAALVIPDLPASRALEILPWWSLLGLGVLFIYASLSALRSGTLYNPELKPTQHMAKEGMASAGLGFAWLVYLAMVGISLNIYAHIPIIMSVGVIVGFGGHFWALRVSARRVQQGKEQTRRTEG